MITAQVRLYPLGQLAIGPAIERVMALLDASGLVVEPTAMSTILAGEPPDLFDTLYDAFALATTGGAAVLMVTVTYACPLPEA
jgi:uncharacterized protein YqgV (UPF0045/DUF77 family)